MNRANGVMRSVVAVAFIGMAAPAVAYATPGVPTGPDDPACAAMPEAVQCQGGPYDSPTGPLDPQCISTPTDAMCAGGPYAIPTPTQHPAPLLPPAPMDGGMPGMAGMPGMP